MHSLTVEFSWAAAFFYKLKMHYKILIGWMAVELIKLIAGQDDSARRGEGLGKRGEEKIWEEGGGRRASYWINFVMHFSMWQEMHSGQRKIVKRWNDVRIIIFLRRLACRFFSSEVGMQVLFSGGWHAGSFLRRLACRFFSQEVSMQVLFSKG